MIFRTIAFKKKSHPQRKEKDNQSTGLQKKVAELINLRMQNKKEKFNYQSMFNNLDRIWSKLPEDVVEELNFKIISLSLEELRNMNK